MFSQTQNKKIKADPFVEIMRKNGRKPSQLYIYKYIFLSFHVIFISFDNNMRSLNVLISMNKKTDFN